MGRPTQEGQNPALAGESYELRVAQLRKKPAEKNPQRKSSNLSQLPDI